MVEQTVADDDVVMIRGAANTRAVSVLLRGANDYLLDEMDRSLHDAFCIVKRVLESGVVVPGASRGPAAARAAVLSWLGSVVHDGFAGGRRGRACCATTLLEPELQQAGLGQILSLRVPCELMEGACSPGVAPQKICLPAALTSACLALPRLAKR